MVFIESKALKLIIITIPEERQSLFFLCGYASILGIMAWSGRGKRGSSLAYNMDIILLILKHECCGFFAGPRLAKG
jgi:hypothetical protein